MVNEESDDAAVSKDTATPSGSGLKDSLRGSLTVVEDGPRDSNDDEDGDWAGEVSAGKQTVTGP